MSWPTDLAKSASARRAPRLSIHKAAAEGEQRIVFGEVLVPEDRDLQGDIYSHEEVERAAHRYLARYRTASVTPHKDQHNRRLGDGDIDLLESYIAPVDFEINGRQIKRGTWLMKARINDLTIWADVKAGRRTGFSIGGMAKSRPG